MATKKDILATIIEEINSIPIYKVDPVHEYSRLFFLNCRVNHPADYTNIDIWKWFVINYYNGLRNEIKATRQVQNNMNNTEEDEEELFDEYCRVFELAKQHAEKIKPIVNALTTHQFVKLMVQILQKPDKLRKKVEQINNSNRFNNPLKSFFNDEMEALFTTDNYEELKESLLFLIKCTQEHNCISEALSVFVPYKSIKETITRLYVEIPELSKACKRKQLNQIPELRDVLISHLKLSTGVDYEEEVIKPIKKMQNWCSDVDKTVNENSKKNEKRRNILIKIQSLISDIEDNEEITNARELVKGLDEDSPLKKTILMWVYNHNQELYDSLLREYEDLRKDDTNVYRSILVKYRIRISDKEIDLIRHNLKPEEVESIIKSLRIRFFSDEEIIRVLKTTTIDIYNRVDDYLNSDFYSIGFIKDNIDIYRINGTKLAKYEEMINFLQAHQINPALFKQCAEILFDNHALIKNNILLLEEYGLLNSLKSSKELSFVLDNKLVEKIDLFIEMGLLDLLQNNIGILNFNSNEIKRLKLLYMINGYTFFDEDNNPLMDWEKLFELIKKDDFFIADEKIEECLISPVENKRVELIDCSSQIKKDIIDPRITHIGDSIFSTKKIERKLKEGLPLYNSIFFNKICSPEEYERIMKELSPSQLTN